MARAGTEAPRTAELAERRGAIEVREARPEPRAAAATTPTRAAEAAVADIVRACVRVEGTVDAT